MKMLFGVAVRHVCTKCGPALEDGGGYIPGNFFIRALLLGFYIFAIARRLYRRIHDIGPAPEPDGESRDAPPGARGGVEPGTGYISRSPPRYQENGQLTRGVYR